MKYFAAIVLAVILAGTIASSEDTRTTMVANSKGQRKQSGNGSYFGKRADSGKLNCI